MAVTGYVRRREAWEDVAEAYSQHMRACCCEGKRFVRAAVPLGHPLFGKAIPCVCQRDRGARERAQRLRRLCGISDAELSAWTFETFDPMRCVGAGETAREVQHQMARIVADCQAWSHTPQGWLILYGVPGAGKTHLAYAIAAQALADGRAVFAHTVPDILQRLRASYNDQTFDETLLLLQSVELLVLDDLGAQRDTDWTLETLYQLVNNRYARRMAMVMTTNCDLRHCGLDARLVSRLLEGTETKQGWTRIITLPCGDYRPKAIPRPRRG